MIFEIIAYDIIANVSTILKWLHIWFFWLILFTENQCYFCIIYNHTNPVRYTFEMQISIVKRWMPCVVKFGKIYVVYWWGFIACHVRHDIWFWSLRYQDRLTVMEWSHLTLCESAFCLKMYPQIQRWRCVYKCILLVQFKIHLKPL